jgi:hypothetical protein
LKWTPTRDARFTSRRPSLPTQQENGCNQARKRVPHLRRPPRRIFAPKVGNLNPEPATPNSAQNPVPHPVVFFLTTGWESTNANPTNLFSIPIRQEDGCPTFGVRRGGSLRLRWETSTLNQPLPTQHKTPCPILSSFF